jgi:hypothetical protein
MLFSWMLFVTSLPARSAQGQIYSLFQFAIVLACPMCNMDYKPFFNPIAHLQTKQHYDQHKLNAAPHNEDSGAVVSSSTESLEEASPTEELAADLNRQI